MDIEATFAKVEQFLAANPEFAASVKAQLEAAAAVAASGQVGHSSGRSKSSSSREAEAALQAQQQLLLQLQQQALRFDPQPAPRERERDVQQQQHMASSSRSNVQMHQQPVVQNVQQPQMLNVQAEVDKPTPIGNGMFLASNTHMQQIFASGAPPTMVIAPTQIPLYPGYSQVPAGPGYVQDKTGTKYTQLLAVVEEMSKDLRSTYSGSKASSERFKRGIAQARIMLRECMHESSVGSGSSRN
ncbi:Cyclin-dependent kinase 2-associated protein 1 [Halotydeus destructor]|nr:Cyclin-dependent kinase 2-associated protein 1 [Halotydeus destructor]